MKFKANGLEWRASTCGTTKVVPFQNHGFGASFSVACKTAAYLRLGFFTSLRSPYPANHTLVQRFPRTAFTLACPSLCQESDAAPGWKRALG